MQNKKGMVSRNTPLEQRFDVEYTAIIADLDNATDGLVALKALIDANQVDLDAILARTTEGNLIRK